MDVILMVVSLLQNLIGYHITSYHILLSYHEIISLFIIIYCVQNMDLQTHTLNPQVELTPSLRCISRRRLL